MKRKLFALATLGVVFAFNFTASAQDDNDDDHTIQISIPEVAILDLEATSGTSVVLNVSAPSEAGLPVSFANAKDSSVWINYSSIVGSSTEASRNVSAKISGGSVPGGMLLKVTAANDAGNGDGKTGSSSGVITLSNTNQTVITGIGSCYTGNGANNGHNLYYSLELDPAAGSYANIDFDDATTLTIIYTISNN
ncbi:MAG: hypothetical protein GC181_07870 [Bacteroidetes bacterium]|nr:hypothetical protein [Bacteroidota bacterium]